ncbi:MAG: DUF2853 family protein [Formosa sp.]|jgi:hypothetical protein|nr:DUF2853 family protein [Formosa sp.]
MNAREKLIVKYISDLREKCNINPDMDLLKKVTIGCGPAIYNSDSSTISGTNESELITVRNKFLIKKLGLSTDDKLNEGIDAVIEQYGRSNRHKYRAVFYYLLVKRFGKESVYE